MQKMLTNRERAVRREKGKALVRALHLTELATAGRARALALHEANEQLDRIGRLVPGALQGGISMTEIGRITDVSRPTLYELRGRYGGAIGDLRFALLLVIATRQPVSRDELQETLGDQQHFEQVFSEFEKQRLIEYDVEPTEVGDDQLLVLMAPDGYRTLEEWEFEITLADDKGGSDK
jgi:hypothetical protein